MSPKTRHSDTQAARVVSVKELRYEAAHIIESFAQWEAFAGLLEKTLPPSRKGGEKKLKRMIKTLRAADGYLKNLAPLFRELRIRHVWDFVPIVEISFRENGEVTKGSQEATGLLAAGGAAWIADFLSKCNRFGGRRRDWIMAACAQRLSNHFKRWDGIPKWGLVYDSMQAHWSDDLPALDSEDLKRRRLCGLLRRYRKKSDFRLELRFPSKMPPFPVWPQYVPKRRKKIEVLDANSPKGQAFFRTLDDEARQRIFGAQAPAMRAALRRS